MPIDGSTHAVRALPDAIDLVRSTKAEHQVLQTSPVAVLVVHADPPAELP